MARLTPKQIKILVFAILGCIIAGVISVTVLIFSLISRLITVPGAILVFLLGIWLTVRFLIRLMIFPGSVWLWRRSIETHFCREMAQQTLHRMHDLRIGLEILLDLSNEREKSEFLERSSEATAYGKRILATLVHTFQFLKEEETLTKPQEELLNLLLELQSALEETHIVQNNRESCSMWDWMEASYEESDWLNVVFDDFPNNTNAQTARELIIKLEEILFSSCGEVPMKDKIKRWLFDTRLGTIDQMRVELMSRFNCEQIWLSAEDTVLIDCLWIPGVSNSADAPTILLCNPNAGFYEFAYYQNEWLDYYLNSGINVFMWNYRGYGRTKGSPSLARIKKDGEIIVDYLKRVRKVGRLGVHGESLGGCIATHLARYCEVDFLFADRSFSSISEVALYNFGKFAYWMYRLSRKADTDASMDFLAVECYKILSADPQDGMINDMASLKSGVAIRLVSYI
jgi:hypothetical protein